MADEFVEGAYPVVRSTTMKSHGKNPRPYGCCAYDHPLEHRCKYDPHSLFTEARQRVSGRGADRQLGRGRGASEQSEPYDANGQTERDLRNAENLYPAKNSGIGWPIRIVAKQLLECLAHPPSQITFPVA